MVHPKQQKSFNSINFSQLILFCMVLRSTWESATALYMSLYSDYMHQCTVKGDRAKVLNV